MTTQILIATLFGFDIEVYFILIILGIPTFFLCRRLFKKFIPINRTRKIATWTATIILTPIIYLGLILLIFNSYYKSRDFGKQQWVIDKDKRYELSDKLITSKILIGKSKAEIRQLLGDETDNQDTLNVWSFELGFKPDIGNIDPSYLHIEFKNDKVVTVGQTK
jgi:predicted histidine transporter YuiF (NhaC family)